VDRKTLIGIAALTPLLAGCPGTSNDPCQVALLRHLKAPSTAKVTMLFDDRLPDGTRDAGGWFDAQNSFGAMLRGGFVCEISPDGSVVHIAKVDDPKDFLHRDFMPHWLP
jgi:hypothetical protein